MGSSAFLHDGNPFLRQFVEKVSLGSFVLPHRTKRTKMIESKYEEVKEMVGTCAAIIYYFKKKNDIIYTCTAKEKSCTGVFNGWSYNEECR